MNADLANCVYNSANNNQRGISFMRSLSVYGLIGAIFGVLAILILTAIAVPAYNEYLMPLAMYRDITAIAPLASVFDKMVGWLPWTALILFVWVWWLVAGRLHPALARLPRTGEGNLAWTWAAWIGGGLLLLMALVLVLSMFDLGFLGMGGRADALKWIVVMVASALAWLLVSPQALGRFGSQHPATLNWLAIARTAGLGVLFILAFGLVMKAMGATFNAWFLVVTEALDRSMEPSVFGWTWLTIGMVVTMALGSAVALGLLPAFVPGAGNWRARIVATRPALILAAGALVVGAVSLPVLSRIDYLGNKRLVDVAELSGIRPFSFRLVKFCADKNCRESKDRSANPALKTGKPIVQVASYGSLRDGGYVPLHPDTVAALERFVAGKGTNSVLRKSAMMGATEVYKALWQPHEMYRLVDRFTRQGSMKHGSLIDTQIRLAWLMRAAPINAETRAMLEELSDDKRYFIGTRATVRLAAAWARFGDMKRAEGLLASARKTSPGKYDHIKLVPGGQINGQLSGRIVVAGSTSDGIRAGLFRQTEDPTKKVSPDDLRKQKLSKGSVPGFAYPGISLLTESTVLKADGRFAFRNLGAGEYYLAILLPDEKLKDKARLTGTNVPDLIKLSAAAPRRDVGVIRLTAQ